MGFMAGCPIAGVVWQHIHYIVGLQRLGHEVYYIEYSARWPYNPTACEVNTDYSYAITALDRLLATRFGFKGHRAFCALFAGRSVQRLARQKIVELYCNSDAILS